MIIRHRISQDNPRLTQIWLDAVRITHLFLSDADIEFYHPLVRDQYIPGLDVWVATSDEGVPLGFIGLTGHEVNMLFVDPAAFRQGLGRQLIEHAQRRCGPLGVDVNEQNPDAHAFYRKCGFVDVGRSETDDAGRPFPIIHMAQPPVQDHQAC